MVQLAAVSWVAKCVGPNFLEACELVPLKFKSKIEEDLYRQRFVEKFEYHRGIICLALMLGFAGAWTVSGI